MDHFTIVVNEWIILQVVLILYLIRPLKIHVLDKIDVNYLNLFLFFQFHFYHFIVKDMFITQSSVWGLMFKLCQSSSRYV